MRDCVALGNVAQDLIAVQLADNTQFRGCGNVRQSERKADLLQHAVCHRVVGLRLADDALQIESFVEIERRQAKEARAVALTPQIGEPDVQMYAAELARHDVLERRMSDRFAVDAPCKYEATKPIERSSDHRLQIGTQPGGRRHSIDCKAHALGVDFGRSRKVSDVTIQIFPGERANSQSRNLAMLDHDVLYDRRTRKSAEKLNLSDSARTKSTSRSDEAETEFAHILFAKGIVPTDHSGVTDHIEAFTRQICEVIVGKNQAVKLSVACLLARGHLLIEDIPGVGKTTLSQTLARSLALAFQRIQFTSDLLPADILGNSIFDRTEQRFVFHRGPLFSQVVLIDEVNRATAKTQSALLEAMEEHRISVDGMTYNLPEPFFVVATQNPQHAVGTFPLPESQLDRFLMRIELGVPDRTSERAMLLGMDRREMLKELKPVMSPRTLIEIQHNVRKVYASPALLDYLQDLLDASRQRHSTGLSPRAGLALLHASQAWALMHGREMLLPEDIQAVGVAVMAHRLGHDLEQSGQSGRTLADNLLHSVPVP